MGILVFVIVLVLAFALALATVLVLVLCLLAPPPAYENPSTHTHTPLNEVEAARSAVRDRLLACWVRCFGKLFVRFLGQLGSKMFKRSCLRGKSGFLFEHVGSNESLDVLVPQICPLVLVDGKLFLSSRRWSFCLWRCSLEVEFGKYRFKHRCKCSRSGCGALPFYS